MTDTLRLPAELSQLAAARQFVEQTSARLGLPSAEANRLILAVDELLSNIIQHGYHGQPGVIEIEIERAPDSLVVRLRDQAPPFDPTQSACPRHAAAARPAASRRHGRLPGPPIRGGDDL